MASNHNKIAKGLHEFIMANNMALAKMLLDNYLYYSYFAFTALGCEVTVETREIDGKEVNVSVPVGPITPKRIEEPIFWLFKNLGYIDSDVPCLIIGQREVVCPICESHKCFELPDGEQFITERVGLFKTRTKKVNYQCEEGHMFWVDPQ